MKRQPAGVPTGGQFAPDRRSESDVELGRAAPNYGISSRDIQVLRAIGYSGKLEITRANQVATPATVRRLATASLIEMHDEWTGCLRLTARPV